MKKKTYPALIKAFLIIFSGMLIPAAFTQVLNPADPIVIYNPASPPATPPFGQIAKWVKTTRMGWNTDSYKCYFFKGYAFRLKFPKSYQHNVNDGKTYPVYVFFHGAGELGTIYDNENQLLWGGETHKNAVDNGQFDGYLLYLQSTGPGWSNSSYDVINELIQSYIPKADPYRVIANGLSAGGGATWTFMERYPKLIAADLPISSIGGSGTAGFIPSFKFTPVWHFQGAIDVAPQAFNARILRDQIVAAGGNYRYTEYPGVGHGCWNLAWSEPDYFPYLTRANKVNPWPLFGRTVFCTGETINVTIGLTAGFDEYQWRKDGSVIPGASTNTIQATTTGVYDCRVRTGTSWSYWSPIPVKITVKQNPVDVMLVLDGSGSMSWGYDGSFAPPAGQRRWDGLKTGVGIMATQLSSQHCLTSDKLGLRLFSTGVITPSAPFNGNLVDMQTNVNQLNTVLTPDPPGGSTALGDGILAGRDMLATGPGTDRKALIVFSDGEQNAGDMIKETGAGQFIQTNSGQNISNSGQFKIYTINLGASGSNPALMEKIAISNGGQYLSTLAGAESNFQVFFSTQINNIYAGSSPQFVDIRKVSAPSQQTFAINKGASSMILTLLAPSADKPQFTSLVKEGTDYIQYTRQTSGPGFLSLTLSDSTGRSLPTLDGIWTVGLKKSGRLESPGEMTLTIVTDDHHLEPLYSLGANSFRVGDALTPTVTLKQIDRSIQNAAVQAIVMKPGDDLNDLLSRTSASYTLPAVDPGSPAVAKLAVLLKDAAFVQKIQAQDRLVNLTYNPSENSYKGLFNGLDVAGVYQVIFRINGRDADLDSIQRYHQMNLYVRFRDIDLNRSNLVASIDPASGNSILTARFISSTGKYIGSGWGPTIGLEAAGLKILKVDDLGDGTYKIHFDGKLAGNGKLTLFTDTLYDGNLAGLGKEHAQTGLSLSIHGGRTFPIDKFNDDYNPGWLGEIDLEYSFSRSLSAELVGGYYNFDSSYKIIGATAYLKAFANFGPSFKAYIGAGPGYYKPDNISGSFGLSGKVGLQRALGNKLWLDINGNYFKLFVPDKNRDFLSAGIGLKYFF